MGIAVMDVGPGTYADAGRALASAWGTDACTLFGLRWSAARVASRVRRAAELRALAEAHLEPFRAFDPGVYAEMEGFATQAGLELWQLVVLCAQDDFEHIGAGAGGCSAVYAPLPDGPALAQTWDLPGVYQPFVRLVRLQPPDGPPVVLFTLTGSPALCGMNAHGVAVCVNDLTASDARVGVPWPVVVRAMLKASSALEAVEVLRQAPRAGGRAYLVADPTAVFGVETTAARLSVVHQDAKKPCWHTNHYIDADLRRYQLPLTIGSTSPDRYQTLSRWLVRAPTDAGALWTGLGKLDPIALRPAGAPDTPWAARTVGGVLFDLRNHRVLAHAGPVDKSSPTMVDVHP